MSGNSKTSKNLLNIENLPFNMSSMITGESFVSPPRGKKIISLLKNLTNAPLGKRVGKKNRLDISPIDVNPVELFGKENIKSTVNPVSQSRRRVLETQALLNKAARRSSRLSRKSIAQSTKVDKDTDRKLKAETKNRTRKRIRKRIRNRSAKMREERERPPLSSFRGGALRIPQDTIKVYFGEDGPEITPEASELINNAPEPIKNFFINPGEGLLESYDDGERHGSYYIELDKLYIYDMFYQIFKVVYDMASNRYSHFIALVLDRYLHILEIMDKELYYYATQINALVIRHLSEPEYDESGEIIDRSEEVYDIPPYTGEEDIEVASVSNNKHKKKKRTRKMKNLVK